MTIKIYHNARCSKSRKTLEIIKNKTSNFKVVEYLKNPLTFNKIKLLLSQLKIKPLELIRTQESIWKENYKNIKLTDDEIINLIVSNPKLMERPIVTNNKKAVIGRPPENVHDLFI